MLHAMNPMSLTHWKMQEGNSLAHATCDEFDITYMLEGEVGGQFVSPHCMRGFHCHLLPER